MEVLLNAAEERTCRFFVDVGGNVFGETTRI